MSARIAIAKLEVLPAGADDTPAARAILEQAAAWLHGRGIEQWPLRWGAAEERYLRERIASGELYLARLDGRPTATIVLQWADPSMWGQRPPDAGYVHRLAVRRDCSGRGIGRALLEWAAARIVAAGRTFLRLDCMADNHGLCAYYERLGFQAQGEIGNDRWTGRLYQQPARRLLAQTKEVNDGAPA